MPKEDSSSSWYLYFSSRSLIASSRRSFCRLSNWAARILTSLIKSVSRVVLYILRLLILYYTSIEISVTIRITLEKNRRSLPTARGNLGGKHGAQIQKQTRNHIGSALQLAGHYCNHLLNTSLFMRSYFLLSTAESAIAACWISPAVSEE